MPRPAQLRLPGRGPWSRRFGLWSRGPRGRKVVKRLATYFGAFRQARPSIGHIIDTVPVGFLSHPIAISMANVKKRQASSPGLDKKR